MEDQPLPSALQPRAVQQGSFLTLAAACGEGGGQVTSFCLSGRWILLGSSDGELRALPLSSAIEQLSAGSAHDSIPLAFDSSSPNLQLPGTGAIVQLYPSSSGDGVVVALREDGTVCCVAVREDGLEVQRGGGGKATGQGKATASTAAGQVVLFDSGQLISVADGAQLGSNASAVTSSAAAGGQLWVGTKAGTVERWQAGDSTTGTTGWKKVGEKSVQEGKVISSLLPLSSSTLLVCSSAPSSSTEEHDHDSDTLFLLSTSSSSLDLLQLPEDPTPGYGEVQFGPARFSAALQVREGGGGQLVWLASTPSNDLALLHSPNEGEGKWTRLEPPEEERLCLPFGSAPIALAAGLTEEGEGEGVVGVLSQEGELFIWRQPGVTLPPRPQTAEVNAAPAPAPAATGAGATNAFSSQPAKSPAAAAAATFGFGGGTGAATATGGTGGFGAFGSSKPAGVGGGGTASFGFGGFSSPSSAVAAAATTGFGFGTTSSSSSSSSSSTPTTKTAAPAFGAPAFGAPAFGKPAAAASPAAGGGTPAFGAPAFGAPAFGAPAFGAAAKPAAGGGFGAFGAAAAGGKPAGFAGFGTPQSSSSAAGTTGGFGGFGTSGSTGGGGGGGFAGFAATNGGGEKKEGSGGGSIFGDGGKSFSSATTTTSAFGAPVTPSSMSTSAFGTPTTPTTASGFGATVKTATANASASAFGGGGFGSSSPGATFGFGGGTTTSSGSPVATFGTTTSSTPVATFGGTTSTAAPTFGTSSSVPTPTFGTSSFGTTASKPAFGSPGGGGGGFGFGAPAFGKPVVAGTAGGFAGFGTSAAAGGKSPFATSTSGGGAPPFAAAAVGGAGAAEGKQKSTAFKAARGFDSSDEEEEDEDLLDDDGARVDDPPDLEPTMTGLDLGRAMASAKSSLDYRKPSSEPAAVPVPVKPVKEEQQQVSRDGEREKVQSLFGFGSSPPQTPSFAEKGATSLLGRLAMEDSSDAAAGDKEEEEVAPSSSENEDDQEDGDVPAAVTPELAQEEDEEELEESVVVNGTPTPESEKEQQDEEESARFELEETEDSIEAGERTEEPDAEEAEKEELAEEKEPVAEPPTTSAPSLPTPPGLFGQPPTAIKEEPTAKEPAPTIAKSGATPSPASPALFFGAKHSAPRTSSPLANATHFPPSPSPSPQPPMSGSSAVPAPPAFSFAPAASPAAQKKEEPTSAKPFSFAPATTAPAVAAATPLFGQQQPTASNAAPSTSSSLFGQPSTPSTTLFGQAPAPAMPLFGQPPPAANKGFGAPPPASGSSTTPSFSFGSFGAPSPASQAAPPSKPSPPLNVQPAQAANPFASLGKQPSPKQPSPTPSFSLSTKPASPSPLSQPANPFASLGTPKPFLAPSPQPPSSLAAPFSMEPPTKRSVSTPLGRTEPFPAPSQAVATPPPQQQQQQQRAQLPAESPKVAKSLIPGEQGKVAVQEKGMTGEFLRAYLVLEEEFATLRKSTDACRAYTAALKEKTRKPASEMAPSEWTMGDLSKLRELTSTYTAKVEALIGGAASSKTSAGELQSDLLKTEAKRAEIARFVEARQDPSLREMVRARELGPEQAEDQRRIRSAVKVLEERLVQVEKEVGVLKARADDKKAGKLGYLKAPSLDTIHRSIRNITMAANEKIFELDELSLKLDKMRLGQRGGTPKATPSKGLVTPRKLSRTFSADNDTFDATHSPLRAPPLVTTPAPKGVPVAAQPAGEDKTEKVLKSLAQSRALKEALLAMRSEPLLNTTALRVEKSGPLAELQIAFVNGPVTSLPAPPPKKAAPVAAPAAQPPPPRFGAPPDAGGAPAFSLFGQPAATAARPTPPSFSFGQPAPASPSMPLFQAPSFINFDSIPQVVDASALSSAGQRRGAAAGSRYHSTPVKARAPSSPQGSTTPAGSPAGAAPSFDFGFSQTPSKSAAGRTTISFEGMQIPSSASTIPVARGKRGAEEQLVKEESDEEEDEDEEDYDEEDYEEDEDEDYEDEEPEEPEELDTIPEAEEEE